MTLPSLNEERRRIRHFLIEVDHAVEQEREDEAVIVYTEESIVIVYQLHVSAYSSFFTD